MYKIVNMDDINLPTKYPGSEAWDLMDSYTIGYNEAINDFMKFLNTAPDYHPEGKSTIDTQKLYEDFCTHLNNMTDEEWRQSVAEAEAACLDETIESEDVIFTDNSGNRYKVTGAEFYATDKDTGEVRFHFPIKIGVLPKE